MIRRNTWILLAVLVILVGVVVYFNNQKNTPASAATPTASQQYLFTSQDGKPTDIKIVDIAGHSVEIARDSAGTWVLKAPTSAASQGQAEAAATQITALSLFGNVQLGLDVVGLDKPAYVMTVTFDNTKTHKVLIGSVTPIQTGYYVQVDGGQIKVADKSGIDSLVGMLTTPPYLATLTPPITPTPIPSNTPTAKPSDTPAPTLATAVSTTGASPSSTPTP